MKNIIKNPEKISKADIVIGIPSFNEADNIDCVVKTIDAGLEKYYKSFRRVIINVDNDSPDGTRDVFLKTTTKTPKVYISTGKGIRGKGNNFFNLFNYTKKIEAKAVMVVDADMKSVTPEWVKIFLDPILEKKYEYVTPYYARNEYDGTITNNIVYPLLMGIYGVDLRQPIGGDFAFSNKLIDVWLNNKWHKTTKQYGIDIFMTLGAVLGRHKICQVGVGEKIHKPSAPKLGPMFSQVVATMFKNIIKTRKEWQDIETEKKMPLLGKRKLGIPQSLGVDYKSMRVASIFEYKMNKDIIKRALSPEVFEKLDSMYEKKHIFIGKSLWTKIIFDSLYAYETTDINMAIIEALRPLYFGRVITFIKETMDLSYVESEKEIVDQARLFWDMRPYLLRKYQ